MDIWRKWRNPRQKPPFGARIDWSDPITEDLVGCWLFNEYSGRAAFDLVSSERCLLVGGASLCANGLCLDGSTGYGKVEKHLASTNGNTVICGLFTKAGLYNGTDSGVVSDRVNLAGSDFFQIFLDDDQYSFSFIVADSTESLVVGSYNSVVEFKDYILAARWCQYYIDFRINNVFQGSNTGKVYTPSRATYFGYYYEDASDRYLNADIYYVFFWNRTLSDYEIERLYYEPYSFFLIPAARIFDLAPSSGFTTTQDITWRLFTSKENQIIYNILTDKQASFGYKIFDRKDNSITYRIFTQDGYSFTWKLFTTSNQDISYKIFARLQSDLSWAIASTALSQAITYRIFTRNEVNLSWLILTAEAASLDWSIFTTKEQQAIWNILAQTETDLIWDIYTRKDTALAYKIFKDLDQDLIYKIFNSTEQDLVWKILAAGLLSEILSWKIYAKQEDGLSWKVFVAEQQEFFYKIFNIKEDEITWLIKREDAADLSWKLFNLKEDPILWKIYSQAEKTLAWSILAALTTQDISYKIFTVKDEELFYSILAEASKSLDWKIYNEKGEELTWRIISEILPEPTYHLKASKRVFVINPTRGIIITKE